jgi:hypothetical protein
MLGNQQEPGITSSVASAPTLSSGTPSAGTPALIGGANLANGDANADEVHAIANAVRARRLFGNEDNSRLTSNIIDALSAGASPVVAIAPGESVTTQDISGLGSSSGSLAEPTREDLDDITVTVDSDDKTPSFVYDDPSGMTVPNGEVYINPATGDFELDAAPSTSGSIEHTALGYTSALDALMVYNGDVDFYGVLKERSSVVNYTLSTANERANEYRLGLAVAGVEPNVDPASWTNSWDTSRLQLIAPGRLQDGSSTVGAFVGMRANIGLTTTAINQRLSFSERPMRALSLTERGDFIDSYVTPMETLGTSARVADDLTTVSDSNSEEQGYRYGFSRLAVDFVIGVTHDLEQPFVGKFAQSLGVLQDLLDKNARPLNQSNVVNEHDVQVELVSQDTARVIFQADVADPIRFIENDFIIGNGLN